MKSMTKMISLVRTMCVTAIVSLLAQCVWAGTDVVSINMCKTFDNVTADQETLVGTVPVSDWVVCDGVYGSKTDATTGVTVEWDIDEPNNRPGGTCAIRDMKVADTCAYFKSGLCRGNRASAPYTISVQNIAFNNYKAYIYFTLDNYDGTSSPYPAVTVNDGTSYRVDNGILDVGVGNWGTGPDADPGMTAPVLNENAICLENLTGSTLKLSGTCTRGGIAAIQIVKTIGVGDTAIWSTLDSTAHKGTHFSKGTGALTLHLNPTADCPIGTKIAISTVKIANELGKTMADTMTISTANGTKQSETESFTPKGSVAAGNITCLYVYRFATPALVSVGSDYDIAMTESKISAVAETDSPIRIAGLTGDWANHNGYCEVAGTIHSLPGSACTATLNADTTFANIAYDEESMAPSATTPVELTINGNVTVTVDAAAEIASLKIKGEGNFKLTGSAMLTLDSVDASGLTGSVTLDAGTAIPTSAIVKAGATALVYNYSGNEEINLTKLSFSGNFTKGGTGTATLNKDIAAGTTVTVAAGTLKYTNGSTNRGFKGNLVVEKGATLVSLKGDVMYWDSPTQTTIDIYGTLDLARTRWTLNKNTLTIHTGGVIIGHDKSSETNGGGNINYIAATTVYVSDAGGIGDTAEISAIIAPQGGAMTFDVPTGKTLVLSAADSCNDSNRRNAFAKSGAGTLKITGNYKTLDGFSASAGTVKLTNTAQLPSTNTQNGSMIGSGVTLDMSDVTSDAGTIFNTKLTFVDGAIISGLATVTTTVTAQGVIKLTDGATLTVPTAFEENVVTTDVDGKMVVGDGSEATPYALATIVAKIGTTPYASIEAAVAALTGEQTPLDITLVGDSVTALPAGCEDYKIVNGQIVAKVYVAQVGDAKFESITDAMAVDGAIKIIGTPETSVALTKNITLDVGTDLELTTVFSGAHSITKIGAGKLTLNADNTFTGGLIVNEGTVKETANKHGLGGFSGSPDCDHTPIVTVGANGTLDASGIATGGTDYCYQVVLSGTLTNSGDAISESWRQLSKITVAADTAKITGNTFCLVHSNFDPTKIVFGEGSLLTIELSEANTEFKLRKTSISGTGTINVKKGYLTLLSNTSIASNANVSFVLEGTGKVSDNANVITAELVTTPDEANKVVKNGTVFSVGAKSFYTISATAEHATVSGLPTAAVREDADAITFTVTPATGYNLTAVKANGTVYTAGENGVYTIKIAADTEITVETAIKTFTITITPVANTTVTVDGEASTASSVMVDYGTNHTIVYTADMNYKLNGEGSFTLENVTADTTVGNTLSVALIETEIAPSTTELQVVVPQGADSIVIESADVEIAADATAIPFTTGIYTITAKKDGVVVAESQIGVINVEKIETAATHAVAVPFKGKTVATLLNTALLNAGDTLMAWVDDNYEVWTLQEDKTWKQQPITRAGGQDSEGIDPAEAALKCGQGVWVTTAGQIVTFGDATTQESEVKISTGHNLLGNTTMKEFTVPASTEGDELVLFDGTSCKSTGADWEANVTVGELGGKPVKQWQTIQPKVGVGKAYWHIKK